MPIGIKMSKLLTGRASDQPEDAAQAGERSKDYVDRLERLMADPERRASETAAPHPADQEPEPRLG